MGASHNGGMGATDGAPHERGGRKVRARVVPFGGGWVLVLGSLLGGCQSPVVRAQQADAEEAENASRTGDWPRAAELWHQVHLEQGGADVRPYYETARALLHTGDRDSACGMLEQGLLVFPEHPDLLELRARVLAEAGFRRSAEECLARVIARYPDRVSALSALARVRMQLGLEQAAVEPLRRLIEITGGDAETYHMLADALRLSMQSTAAFGAYQTAIGFGATEHGLLVQAAQLAVSPEVRAAEPESLVLAATWLSRVIEEDPQSVQAHFIRALLCEACGLTEEAIVHYRRAIELDLTCLDALTNLALVYAERGDVAATREMVERALALEQQVGRRVALQALVERAVQRAEGEVAPRRE